MRGLARRSWRAITRLSARVPLRVKLITAALALVAIALAIISAVSIAVFRGYLLRQADQQLRHYAARPSDNQLGDPFGSFGGPGGYLLEVLRKDGKPLAVLGPGEPRPFAHAPRVSANAGPAIPLQASWISAHAGELVTVPARSGASSWRVIVRPVHYTIQRVQYVYGPNNLRINLTVPSVPGNPATLLVGVDLGAIGQSIRSLTLIDVAVSGVVIVILAGVGVAVVRASLRPLSEIEQTAGAIAAGDLSRRVPNRDPRTEVGSLARSLNLMLGQIEQAFRARSASEAMARQSEERMRRFVADASHELRTPLSVIRGFAEYYRQRGGLKEGELDRMIERVEDEAARMGLLIEDLLLLARLDQQRPLQHNPVDLLALAADAVQDARVLAPSRDIQLDVGSGGPFLVLGDEARLRQVIGNLVNNALTHTPDGTQVEIRLRSSTLGTSDGANKAGRASDGAAAIGEGGRPAVITEVADRGPGLTAQQAERVFERFYRADAARTRRTGGTGLGLAIVAALTAAHGGSAEVDTVPGAGATFRITLPLAPDAAGVQAGPDAEEAAPPSRLLGAAPGPPPGTAPGPPPGTAQDPPGTAQDPPGTTPGPPESVRFGR